MLINILMYASIALVVSLVVFLVGYVMGKGISNITWQLITTKPSKLNGTIGILPDILNTVYIVVLSLIFILPFGVGSAVYLSEYAENKTFVKIIEYAAEILSGIPSIIYGLVGMLLFSNNFGASLLSGALTLTIMNIPTVMRTTQESLKTVPQSYRDGAFGIGAGKWRVVRTIVLPNCVEGIITGSLLSVGRILGESAALLFTAGFAHTLNGVFDIFTSPGATLSVALYVYAKDDGEFGVAFAIAAILMIMTLLINLSAYLISKYFSKKRAN
ncbi:MAG: phosphate ABC transporter permease PstA [Ruminococcaceae bacterium]|nr:phosphate ABC transporter permease PstA [Oscillospiraceae bacterium]